MVVEGRMVVVSGGGGGDDKKTFQKKIKIYH